MERNNSPLDRHMAVVGDPRRGSFSEMESEATAKCSFFFLFLTVLYPFLFFSSSVAFLRSVRGKSGLLDTISYKSPNTGSRPKPIRHGMAARTRELRS